ncbi:hypothetical protein E4T56_gene430 [Termitomyces sp. T112]|nr:hypothetical protein E4T56_gene430 [Termitomyces sp. T112]
MTSRAPNTPPYHEPMVLSSSHGVVQETPRMCRSRVKSGLGRAFVNMSATLSRVLTYFIVISPICSRSQIKWYLMSKCLTLACDVGSSDSVIAALLSQNDVMHSCVDS